MARILPTPVSALLWLAAFLTVVPNVALAKYRSSSSSRTCFDQWGKPIVCPLQAAGKVGWTCWNTTTWKQVDCPPKVKKNQKILIIIICSILGTILLIIGFLFLFAWLGLLPCCRRCFRHKYKTVKSEEQEYAVVKEELSKLQHPTTYPTPYDTAPEPPSHYEAHGHDSKFTDMQKSTSPPDSPFTPPSGRFPGVEVDAPMYQPSYQYYPHPTRY